MAAADVEHRTYFGIVLPLNEVDEWNSMRASCAGMVARLRVERLIDGLVVECRGEMGMRRAKIANRSGFRIAKGMERAKLAKAEVMYTDTFHLSMFVYTSWSRHDWWHWSDPRLLTPLLAPTPSAWRHRHREGCEGVTTQRFSQS